METIMNIAYYTEKGSLSKEKVRLDDGIFDFEANPSLVHQVFVSQRANLRSGTASTKNRSQIVGSTRKIRPQKGTGAARKGSIKSPIQVGGGITFGPSPRSFSKRIPRKMNRNAIKSMLSDKLSDKKLLILDSQGIYEEPSTKQLSEMLKKLKIDSSCLILTKSQDRSFFLSARNIKNVSVMTFDKVNVLSLLNHNWVIVLKDAVESLETNLKSDITRKKIIKD
ncbi:MAG: 50S ribosomal protein L4 [Chloroflexi bacterium]|nr:50S ribosomal protein L4 [Chloroflexota bacterium]